MHFPQNKLFWKIIIMKKFKDVTRDKKIYSNFPLASILGAPPENQGNEGIPGGDV